MGRIDRIYVAYFMGVLLLSNVLLLSPGMRFRCKPNIYFFKVVFSAREITNNHVLNFRFNQADISV